MFREKPLQTLPLAPRLKWLRKRYQSLAGVSRAEVAMAVTWIVTNVIVGVSVYLWLRRQVEEEIGVAEGVIRTLGHINNINMGFVLLPITRNSIWVKVLAMPFERANRYHRLFGYMCFTSVSLHGLGWMLRWTLAGSLGYYLQRPASVTGTAAWVLMVIMVITSLERMRRRHFETFYHTHFIFVGVWTFALIHSAVQHHPRGDPTVLYLAPGLILYAIDRVIRFKRSNIERTKLVGIRTVPPRYTRIEMRKETDFDFKPGQYVFLNVPEISRIEWHPFSISSDPGKPTFALLVKNMGAGSWSDQLYQLAKKPYASSITVKADGPYGLLSVDYHQYHVLVIFCGGIGVTPLVSVLKQLARELPRLPHLYRVYFVWTVRDAVCFSWFTEYFEQLDPKRFDVQFYVSNSDDPDAETPMLNTSFDTAITHHAVGRPDVDAILTNAIKAYPRVDRIGVLASGPTSMVNAVSDACFRNSNERVELDFCAESFLL